MDFDGLLFCSLSLRSRPPAVKLLESRARLPMGHLPMGHLPEAVVQVVVSAGNFRRGLRGRLDKMVGRAPLASAKPRTISRKFLNRCVLEHRPALIIANDVGQRRLVGVSVPCFQKMFSKSTVENIK